MVCLTGLHCIMILFVGKYRFLLRREQVHKIACNHLLTPEINVTPMQTSETAWCWTAQDYSEGECRVEQLAVKFKVSNIYTVFIVLLIKILVMVGK